MKSLRDLVSLEGRVSLVTGGAGHIGSVVCESLAELGASVAVLDLNGRGCAEVTKRTRERHGAETLTLPVDLSEEDAVRSVPETVLKKFGRLDILVNCAALVGTSDLEGWVAPFPRQSSKTWRQAIEVNLTAPFVLVQACAPALGRSKRGVVMNISSIYGMVGPDMRLYEGTKLGNPAAYAASKGGLLQLTRWLATVLAPDIRVNAITLGGVLRQQPEAFRERYVARTPLGRMATEEDVKGAVAYLASDLSAYVTGHNLVVDGGWTAW